MNTRGLLDQLLKSGQEMLQNKTGGKPGASAIKPFPPQPDAKPVSRQESQRPIEDEGPSNKRPRHRGGRRRGGQGGGTPKTEA